MPDREFPIKSPRQLKDWIKNTASKNNLAANTVLQNYMMERFLERVSLSKYRENIILKGGFLIAAMIGIDLRSTLDMDTTIKGMPVSEDEIQKIITEILTLPVDDNVTFETKSIKPIHTEGEYEDFRVGILARNVSNTRARDYYDVHILMKTRFNDIQMEELHRAIIEKAKERNTLVYIKQYEKYLQDIKESTDLRLIWNNYTQKYSYANDISYNELIDAIERCITGIEI